MTSIPSICFRCQRKLFSRGSLLPLQTIPPSILTSIRSASTRTHSLVSHNLRPYAEAAPRRSRGIDRPLRPFSSSGRWRQQALLNPRKDEEGNDMVVEITPRAANRLKEIMTMDANPNLALRITVESGGCHGFQYLMSLTDMTKVSQEEDTVFEGRDGAKIVLDEPSLELLKGSKVDYTMELIGSQFKNHQQPESNFELWLWD